jgi:hypothetical protein
VRNLLTNVVGFAEWLADPGHGLSEAQRLEYAEIIYASALRINEEFEQRHKLVTVAERWR